MKTCPACHQPDEGSGHTPMVIHYTCPSCDHKWEDIWCSAVDGECPKCHTGDIVPVEWDEIEMRPVQWTEEDDADSEDSNEPALFTLTEISAILAGLRIVEQELGRCGYLPHGASEILDDGGTIDPIEREDIDQLCERINSLPLKQKTYEVELEITDRFKVEVDAHSSQDAEAAAEEIIAQLEDTVHSTYYDGTEGIKVVGSTEFP